MMKNAALAGDNPEQVRPSIFQIQPTDPKLIHNGAISNPKKYTYCLSTRWKGLSIELQTRPEAEFVNLRLTPDTEASKFNNVIGDLVTTYYE